MFMTIATLHLDRSLLQAYVGHASHKKLNKLRAKHKFCHQNTSDHGQGWILLRETYEYSTKMV